MVNHDVMRSDIQLEKQERIAAKQRDLKDSDAATLLVMYNEFVYVDFFVCSLQKII